MEVPARFQSSDDEDDVTKASEERPETYVQQSVYGILAAVQGRGRLLPNFDRESGSESDSEKEAETSQKKDPSRSTIGDRGGRLSKDKRRTERAESNTQQPHASEPEHELVKSLLKPVRENNEEPCDDHMSRSQMLPPKNSSNGRKGRVPSDQVVESFTHRNKQRQSDNSMNRERVPMNTPGKEQSDPQISPGEPSGTAIGSESLARAVSEIFKFDTPENVIAEYPCWYLQSALLQGYMYITESHVCFYAYLPKKGSLIKSGHLAKQGKRSSRYKRQWLTLKGDVLSYFASAAEPFFPKGTIDLRFATAADLVAEKDQEQDEGIRTFTITTDKRIYYFRAESTSSAREWVRQLQKVIFRSQNEGDSVKISIPLPSIVDIEPNPILDFAETVKLRAIDSDETYSVDEYFFTFFKDGKNALDTLLTAADKHGANRTTSMSRYEAQSASRRDTGRLEFGHGPNLTRSAILPVTEVASMDSLDTSTDVRSESASNVDIPSPTSTNEENQASPRTWQALNSRSPQQDPVTDISASQLLVEDAAFQSPTLRSSDMTRQESSGRLQHDTLGHDYRTTASARQNDGIQRTGSIASSLPTRAMAAPLQHAYQLAGVVRSHSKRMGSYLSGSPKTYYEKFSEAMAGGKRHYLDRSGLGLGDDMDDPELDLESTEHERRFQEHFALPPTERLRAVYYCSLHRVLPLYGKIYVSERRFCFRSLLYGTRTKLVVPFQEIDNVTKERGFRFRYPGMVLIIRGHEELFFDFGSADARDDCVVTVLRALDVMKATTESVILTDKEQLDAGAAAVENKALQDARMIDAKTSIAPTERPRYRLRESSPVKFDDGTASILDLRPRKRMRITCLTIGSRGDVQPYIALCKGLKDQGHTVTIATHAQFGDWIREHGIEFAAVSGDPAVLMRMCVENGMFTPSFLYEANTKFRTWLDGLLESSWKACANTDLLIESPSVMAGIHIAEALGIPYFRAFTMPWTKTRAYPHAFAMHGKRMGGQYNYTSYTIFDYVFWQAIATQINRWRKNTLGLPQTDLSKMQPNKVPFLYNFSPSVVPPPLDFSDWIRITGYWFLDEGDGWQPPQDLLDFIKKARDDHMKLVYIGFGSVPVSDSKGLTQQIVDAVLKADVRCILSKGWSDHFTQSDPSIPEVKLPPSIFQIRAAPHDWLFKQIDAAVHHGGAGTTGASLRAGVPTVVKPFFGDQFFFATRVDDLGVGLHLKKITVNTLGKAIWWATHDERMRLKARALGAKIRQENGVETAINAIWRDLEYAKTLIKKREAIDTQLGKGEDEEEESWTFVDNESEHEVDEVYRPRLTTAPPVH